MAMKKIRAYTADFKSFDDFDRDELVKDAIIRNFEIMGESVKHVPFNFQRKHKQIPWNQMLALRNFIVHEFFDVDDEVLEDNRSGPEDEEEEDQQDPLQQDHVDVTNLLDLLNRSVTPPLPPYSD